MGQRVPETHPPAPGKHDLHTQELFHSGAAQLSGQALDAGALTRHHSLTGHCASRLSPRHRF